LKIITDIDLVLGGKSMIESDNSRMTPTNREPGDDAALGEWRRGLAERLVAAECSQVSTMPSLSDASMRVRT